jgi:hypothetical protein
VFVRYTLSNVNNTTPVFTSPKTRSSHAWIGLSDRVIRALRRQAERQRLRRLAAGTAWNNQDLVFTRATGQPLRPEYVLNHLHQLSEDADLPRIRVHDLRHFAATTTLSSQIPVAMASKTLRHSTLNTTTEIYGHLPRHVAHQAVEAIDNALTTADHDLLTMPSTGQMDQIRMRPLGDHPNTMATSNTPAHSGSLTTTAAARPTSRTVHREAAGCDHITAQHRKRYHEKNHKNDHCSTAKAPPSWHHTNPSGASSARRDDRIRTCDPLTPSADRRTLRNERIT